MCSGPRIIRLLSLALAALMLWQYGGGRTYAALSQVQLHVSPQIARNSPIPKEITESRFDALLDELREVIRDDGAKTKAAPEKGFAGIERLNTLKDKLATADEKNHEYFAQLEKTIAEKKLPAEIRERHAEFVRQYQSKYDALITNLAGLESAHKTATGLWGKLSGQSKSVNWAQVIDETTAFLDANTPQPRPRQRFDPHNLPHRSLKADKPIAPKLTRDEWLKAFPKEGSPVGPNPVPPSGPPSGLRSEAKTGDTLSPLATAPPVPADLAETIEVKFTPEIRQLADSLDRNPVRIYNWVRNNIEFVPIWGSIQGAQLCLETKSCNAFDTASLVISLLRYSGIPARYQMGTIEVPIEKFKNWAGGFTNAEAAASLFASGGVPSVVRRVNQTGQVVTVRLEHVWVKAFVDYAPSGGVINLQGDTWVPMDAGYKQYSFVQGVDFEGAVPSNTQGFIDQLSSTATIDPGTGSVTNLNTPVIQPFIQQNVSQRTSYLQSNLPNLTLFDAIGGKTVTPQPPRLLPATMPYRVLAHASEVSEIPDSLRHKISLGLGSNPQTPDSPNLFSYAASLPEIAGKNLLLLYTPASPADEAFYRAVILAASAPPFALPSSLNLVPQLYVGDQLVVTGLPTRIGSAVVSQMTFSAPTISTPAIVNQMVAGEAAAIGLDLQGVSQAQVEKLRQRTQDLSANLQLRPPAQNTTNRDFAEVYLASSILNWFGFVDQMNGATARYTGAVTLRYPSAGLFFAKQRVTSLFGVPGAVSPEGLGMDIDRDIVITIAKDAEEAKAVNLTLLQGALGSAMEAEVPIRLLTSAGNQVSGISAMHALRLANDQRIPIYQINATNAETIMPLLQISSDDLRDIQDAVNAGLEVMVSRTPVTFNGGSILGMVIKDPETGSANYLISGGTNGAILVITILIIAILVAIAFINPALLLAIGIASAGGTVTVFLQIALAIFASLGILNATIGANYPDLNRQSTDCNVVFFVLAGLATIAGFFIAGPIGAFFGAFFGIFLSALGLYICQQPAGTGPALQKVGRVSRLFRSEDSYEFS